MKKWSLYILPVLFFGFIYLMFFNQIFNFKTFESDSENRNLAQFPKIDINRLDDFPTQFEAYFDDNFSFRVPFLAFYHNVKFKLGVSPNINDVIIGQNGYFFLAQKDQEIFNGKHRYTEERLDSMMNIWTERNTYFSSKKLLFYWLVAPNKHNVYPEYLPIGYSRNKTSRTVPLATRFNEQFDQKLIYPLAEITAEKQNAYYLHDNHWTEKGAFIGYTALMKRIQQDIPELKMIRQEDINWVNDTTDSGNLLNFIGKGGELTEVFPVAKFKTPSAKKMEDLDIKMSEGFPYPWEYQYHYVAEKAPNQLKALIIRDSYGENIKPFLSESFSESLFIFDAWKYGVNKSIIELFQPDLVIYVTIETLTDNILSYPAIIEDE